MTLFLEFESTLVQGRESPFIDFLIDIFLSNPMKVRGFKLSKPFFTRKHVFRNIESSLDGFGLDGHTCTLRFICEFNSRQADAGLLGEILGTIFTGRVDDDDSHDYKYAQYLGGRRDCAGYGHACPISVYNLPFFRRQPVDLVAVK